MQNTEATRLIDIEGPYVTRVLPAVADASDAFELVEELMARVKLLQRVEEGETITEAAATDNRAEISGILEALSFYVIVGGAR